MEIPFIYGKIVADNDFTDRKEETKRLISNFLSNTNTAIISPRRWGKSSLVNRAIRLASEQESSILFVKMNVFKCETEQDFYELFAKKVIEDISPTADALLTNAKEFISRLLPKISLSDPGTRYEIGFGIDMRANPIGEDILDLPQQIATRRKKKVIVCIDEFQQIGEFARTQSFQKILRSHWQEQKDVAYILYGSKKHMMMHIFGEYASPFYKFGDMMFLPKISNADWTEYICRRFEESGKSISSEWASYLAATVENHSYYVQQLAQYAWLRTEKICSQKEIDDAFLSMLDSMSLQFTNLMDTLTEKQRNFLCAISNGEKNLSSEQVLLQYKLGTSGNIRILKNALKKRDLIETTGSTAEIQDPIFKVWIQLIYANM